MWYKYTLYTYTCTKQRSLNRWKWRAADRGLEFWVQTCRQKVPIKGLYETPWCMEYGYGRPNGMASPPPTRTWPKIRDSMWVKTASLWIWGEISDSNATRKCNIEAENEVLCLRGYLMWYTKSFGSESPSDDHCNVVPKSSSLHHEIPPQKNWGAASSMQIFKKWATSNPPQVNTNAKGIWGRLKTIGGWFRAMYMNRTM